MAALLKRPLKLALVQLACGADKAANLSHARTKVLEAAKAGASLVVLPECFNSPYGTQYFPKYAETLLPSPPTKEQSPSYHALSDLAAEAKTYLVGGSIPELEPSTQKYYNTSMVFSPTGALIGTHRKTHLFDIDIPGKITFKESEVLSAGNKVTIIDLPEYGKIGLAICYDVRFPELAMIAARKGAFLLVYPGAFNMTTGPLHWSLLGRARAVDNQTYVAMCSPARDLTATYHAWGHSFVANPNADIVGELEEKEDIVYADLDKETLASSRKGIPVTTQRRFDVYPDHILSTTRSISIKDCRDLEYTLALHQSYPACGSVSRDMPHQPIAAGARLSDRTTGQYRIHTNPARKFAFLRPTDERQQHKRQPAPSVTFTMSTTTKGKKSGRSAIADVVSREYTIHLHKRVHGVSFKKRAPRAIKEIRAFTEQAMGTKDVRLDPQLNKKVWEAGIKGVPFRLRVRISRKRNDEEGAQEKLYSYVQAVNVKEAKGLNTTVVEDA